MPEWVEILVRAVGLFLLIFLAVRLMGAKSPSRMTAFNYINYLVIGIITTFLILNIINTAYGFLALAVWILLPIGLDYLSLKSKWIHDLVHGKETILIKQGKIMEENLFKTRLTGEELLKELRAKNVFNLADVEFAIMETTGDINVMFKPDKKPLTPKDLDQKVAPQIEPQTVIFDGNIMDEALANIGLNRDWLKTQLEKNGVSLDNVFLAQVDTVGDLYIDVFDDSIQIPQPKVKELVYANLELIHADLLGYSLDTQDKEAKEMYIKNAEKIDKLRERLKPYLLR